VPELYFGKYTGIVKDNRDAQKLGQVHVSVPAIFPPEELLIARAALPYGVFFVPENETKVWVEFDGGDTGLPIWTGAQYVAGEWPTEAAADPPTKRVVKTKAGHLLIFDDTAGSEKVEIRDGANGHVITLDASGIAVTDGVNRHDLKLDASGVALKDGVNQHQVTLDQTGVTIQAVSGARLQLTNAGVTLDAGPLPVSVTGALVRLGPGALPVIRVGDMGIGNLGAPVPITVTTNTQVLA
jgi:hypothetical protein